MLNRIKLQTIKILNDPKLRAYIILGTLVIATIAGGAPEDWDGS